MECRYRNVNDAFRGLVTRIHQGLIPVSQTASRYGDVLHVVEPLMLSYAAPRERVLFNAPRDANPFFHLYEALWMLAGRQDVAPLTYYASRMKEFSDDGTTLNGAYGYRWRHPVDQIEQVIDHLRRKPDSRRAIIQMWNVSDDLMKIDTSKDVCCNLSVCFQINRYHLNMTVFNRSNDLIWGTLGANAVHFSILQEYICQSLGLVVGSYHQITNNAHVYLNTWKPDLWRQWYPQSGYSDPDYCYGCYRIKEPEGLILPEVHLIHDKDTFDRELVEFVEIHSSRGGIQEEKHRWKEPFLGQVAHPMCCAFHLYKQGDMENALELISMSVGSIDWKIAGLEWIQRRMDKRKQRDLRTKMSDSESVNESESVIVNKEE